MTVDPSRQGRGPPTWLRGCRAPASRTPSPPRRTSPRSRPWSRGDLAPAVDRLGAARPRAYVEGRWAHQLAEALLFEDVRAPARRAAAGEHRGHHLGGHPGEVEYDCRPEL